MDEIDISQANQAHELRRLLSAHAYALPRGEAASECDDCGAPIPETRRRVAPGCTRCINCQNMFERKQRGFR